MLNTELKRPFIICFFLNNSFVVIKFSKKICRELFTFYFFHCNAKHSFFYPKVTTLIGLSGVTFARDLRITFPSIHRKYQPVVT